MAKYIDQKKREWPTQKPGYQVSDDPHVDLSKNGIDMSIKNLSPLAVQNSPRDRNSTVEQKFAQTLEQAGLGNGERPVRNTDHWVESDGIIHLEVTAPPHDPQGDRSSGFGLMTPTVFGVATAAGLKLTGPAFPVLAAAVGGVALMNAINSGRFSSISHEDVEDAKLGVRGDLFPDVGVGKIEAGPPSPVRNKDFGDPNGRLDDGPEFAFDHSTGRRTPIDSLEAPVMRSPSDHRPEDALPDPLPVEQDSWIDSEAIIHVAGVPPVDFARRQRLMGFPDGKAPYDEDSRIDILVRLYSQNADSLQTDRLKKLAAATEREVQDNLTAAQFQTPDKHGNSWSKLTGSDYAVLNMYISGNFEFNPALGDNFQRVMKPPGYKSPRDATSVRNTLQAAEVLAQTLAKVPVYEGTAHRGFKLSAQQLEVFQPGSVVSIPNYMSASLGRAPAPPFNSLPVIFSITGEAANIDPANGSEREVIFAPGNYAVLDRREVGGQTLIQLRQLK